MEPSEKWPANGVYRVEVSGWDTDRNFFVEKTELHWDETHGKHTRLSHALRKGSVVFVRLLQVVDVEQSCPVAYEVAPVGNKPNEFRLKQMRPRSSEDASQPH